jgi:predicted dehydrogenase
MTTTRRNLIRSGATLASAVALAGTSAFLSAQGASAAKIKIGVVGTAHSHAAGKVAALRKMPDLFEVIGVVEPEGPLQRLAAAQAEYQGLKFLTEEQLLNVPGLAAVLVETRVRDLVPTATRIATAGVHIHLEKPGGPSLPAFNRLLDRVAEKKRALQMGYMLRRNPAFEFCFRAVKAGWLGEVFEIQGVMGKTADDAERKATAEFSGGMMFELACHLIDAVVSICGKPSDVHSYLRRSRPGTDDLADNTLAVLEYPKVLATVRSAGIDGAGGSRRSFTICGDQGAATILPLEAPRLTLTLAKPAGDFRKGAQPIELRKSPGRFDDQLADFAAIILGEKDLDYTPDHDRAVLETVLRASGMSATD